jgi:hypothetical protein
MRIGDTKTAHCGRALVAALRRVEKSDIASNLREERRRDPARRAAHSHRASPQRMSRYETRYRGEAGNSGIESRFAALVLGQILETRCVDAVLATRAYAPSNRDGRDTRLVRVL